MKKIIASSLAVATIAFVAVFGTAKPTTVYNPNKSKNVSEVIQQENTQVAKTRVRGYYKKNGTYVAPHTRSTPSERYDKYGNYKG